MQIGDNIYKANLLYDSSYSRVEAPSVDIIAYDTVAVDYKKAKPAAFIPSCLVRNIRYSRGRCYSRNDLRWNYVSKRQFHTYTY